MGWVAAGDRNGEGAEPTLGSPRRAGGLGVIDLRSRDSADVAGKVALQDGPLAVGQDLQTVVDQRRHKLRDVGRRVRKANVPSQDHRYAQSHSGQPDSGLVRGLSPVPGWL